MWFVADLMDKKYTAFLTPVLLMNSTIPCITPD